MTTTFDSRTVTVRIARPRDEVYAFASVPENFPRWASGLARSLRKVNDEWIAEAPEGQVKVHFTGRNDFGVLDQHVTIRPGVEVYVPMRVIANGAGSEVIFTVFRLPDMTAETFARDVEWVERDLRALKALLEGGS
jgi:Polyketide cyclase / dehydrase and lipid transport